MKFTGIRKENMELLSTTTSYKDPERITPFYCPAILLEAGEEDPLVEWYFKVIAGPEKGRRVKGFTDKKSQDTQEWAESLAGRILSKMVSPADLEGKRCMIQIEDKKPTRCRVLTHSESRYLLKSALEIQRGLEEIEDPELYYFRQRANLYSPLL